MQHVTAMNPQSDQDFATRTRALNHAAQRVVQRLLGCWQHKLSRPFTYEGKTYRVCVICGLARDFDLATWKTHGSYRLQPTKVSSN